MINFIEVLRSLEAAKVIASEIDSSNYVSLDLSVSNTDLQNTILATAKDYEIFIQNHLDKNNAKIAYGGYLERRNLYKRSTVFKNENTNERDIHIGLDLWINEPAPIFAALDGTIHSFQNNEALGDYGPTIILEHHEAGHTFYTLYGHLSLQSLDGLAAGTVFRKGQILGTLGTSEVNGDYAPHLHFQIIIDLEGNDGDYPGVCNENKLDFYLTNCIDPNLL